MQSALMSAEDIAVEWVVINLSSHADCCAEAAALDLFNRQVALCDHVQYHLCFMMQNCAVPHICQQLDTPCCTVLPVTIAWPSLTTRSRSTALDQCCCGITKQRMTINDSGECHDLQASSDILHCTVHQPFIAVCRQHTRCRCVSLHLLHHALLLLLLLADQPQQSTSSLRGLQITGPA